MSDLADHLPILRPLRDDEDLLRLQRAAAADNHLVLAPSWVIEKGGDVAGYIGLNSLPIYQGWFHTRRMQARDSLTVFNQVENLCRMRGGREVVLLLPQSSAFREIMSRFGYRHVDTVGLHWKTL